MPPRAKLTYDAATAIAQGRRDRQEDSVASDFLAGSGIGFAVLADGMGGHAAGDMASKIAVTEVFAGLKLWSDTPATLEPRIRAVLTGVAEEANACIRAYAQTCPEALGMGATLLAPVIVEDRLYWVSVGDSPLLLLRAGRLYRLNAEHSLAAELDRMVAAGEISAEEAEAHPDRDCVTSVLTGHDIPYIDYRDAPLTLKAGDLVLAASDGVLALPARELEELLRRGKTLSSAELSQRLLDRIEAADLPEQDNVAFCMIRVLPRRPAVVTPAQRRRRRLTFLAAGTRAEGIFVDHSIREGSAR